jgi:hypothetical protein
MYSTVVYIATENNSVYAINATTGTVVAQTHLESAAPSSEVFGGTCGNNSVVIGINSTPVIDASLGTLYVVTTTITGPNTVTFTLHALDVSTLRDKVAPLTIANPSPTSFNRQRSALALFHGGVLIPFSSFCDKLPSLGFITYANMNASPAAQVAFQTSSTKLASIWMSGAGPSISGNSIFFSTGNGQGPYPPAGPPSTNLPESLVGLSGSTGVPLSLAFSGLFANPNASGLDGNDLDFGSGGVLIIPSGAPASIIDGTTSPQFVTAVGKDGNLFVNTMGLGPSYVQNLNVGGNCECVYSYYTGSDGIGRVVMWAGTSLNIYTVSAGGLTLAASLANQGGPTSGGFTSISSNGTVAGTTLIWTAAVGNTGFGTSVLGLRVYEPSATSFPDSVFISSAGTWPNVGSANANIVPVVANGLVFVASYKQLTIYGEPNVVTDSGSFTDADVPGGTIHGYNPLIFKQQTYSPPTLTGGKTVTTLVDLANNGRSQLVVSGFSANPGQGWLASASYNGVTKAGSGAFSYTYSVGKAYWVWLSMFGFPSTGPVTVQIAHQ